MVVLIFISIFFVVFVFVSLIYFQKRKTLLSTLSSDFSLEEIKEINRSIFMPIPIKETDDLKALKEKKMVNKLLRIVFLLIIFEGTLVVIYSIFLKEI